MARPLKEGLDYFPLDIDIDFDQDDKLIVPIAKYGMQGLGVIVKIMMNIYRNGYFYPWEEHEHYALSSKVNADINTVREIVNECINWGFFNENVYKKYKVLTSRGFQKRYIEAAKRRKEVTLFEGHLLIDPLEESKKVSHSIVIVSAESTPVNVYINPDRQGKVLAESTQSKVKESKGEESKEKENEIKPTDLVVPLPVNPFRMFEAEGFGTISSVISDQLNDFISDYGERWLCEAMRTSIIAGKRNLSYVRAILKRWKSEGIDEPWTKEKDIRSNAASNGYRNGRGGQSGKPQIEITKNPVAPPTQEEIELHEKSMAELLEKRRRAEEEKRL
jgi:DnaD/phage-associated family protein